MFHKRTGQKAKESDRKPGSQQDNRNPRQKPKEPTGPVGSIGRQASRQRSQAGNQEASRTLGILGNNLRSLQDLWVP